MKRNDSSRTYRMKRILFITIIVSLFGTGIETLSNTNIPSLIVSAQQDPWNLTLQITEPSGSGKTVILGGSPNASDDTDDLDIPEPPAQPMLPYIRAWFTTSFSIPFNKLLQEYKYILSPRMEWNLSIIWVSENNSPITISINWDPAQAAKSGFNSFKVYENNTVVANLLTEHSYSFLSNGTLHHFQIIGESDLEVLPILLGISVIVIVIIFAFFMYKRKT
ncbi:Uncharacterised protein [uncultured archaeon]|nr:Uncharacterised protein [uncultured archaeon]